MEYEIGGINYFVDQYGDGFPLLLLHGFTGDSTTWQPFYPHWGENRKVIALDIIGHGKSDSPEVDRRYDILSVARDIKTILDRFEIESIDVLGYSMGGRLALSFTIQYPEMVRKLILESSSPGLETEVERNQRRSQDEKLSLFIQENGIERFVDYWQNIPLFASQIRLPLETQNKIRQQRLHNSVIGLMNSLKGMGTGAQPSWWTRLKNVDAETLIITGELDQKYAHIAENMLKELKNAQWVEVKDCGHAIHVEVPEKFGKIVDRFLLSSS